MLFRLIFFVAVISGVAIFTLSNMQPLVLTFLGFNIPGFPLSFWILGAIAAGMLTHAVISSLLHLTTYATARSVRTQLRPQQRRGFSFDSREQTESDGAKAATAASGDSVWRDWGGYEQATRKPHPEPVDQAAAPVSSSPRAEDDWEMPLNDDWEVSSGEFRGVASPRNTYPPNQPIDRSYANTRDRTDFERPQEPKRASQSGSVYSYSYREPSAAPSPESKPPEQDKVVDADYRVLIPPYNPPISNYTPPPPPPEPENADDWFEDDPPASKPG